MVKEVVCSWNKAEGCQQLAECFRFPLWFVMKFIYVPSRWDVIAEKGRLSGCRLYKHMAHLGHCATREKALLNWDLQRAGSHTHIHSSSPCSLSPKRTAKPRCVSHVQILKLGFWSLCFWRHFAGPPHQHLELCVTACGCNEQEQLLTLLGSSRTCKQPQQQPALLCFLTGTASDPHIEHSHQTPPRMWAKDGLLGFFDGVCVSLAFLTNWTPVLQQSADFFFLGVF